MAPQQKKHLAHHFKPGQSGNPTGRPKGSRNKVGEAFLQDFVADWEAGGRQAITQCRLKDPCAYLRIAASLIPKNFDFNEEERSLDKFFDQFTTIDEINEFIAGIRALAMAEKKKEML